MGAGRPNCAARSLKAALRFLSQSLRLSSPATDRESLLALVVFERPALADDLLLLAEDDADIVGVELAVQDQGLGENVLRLLERQPPRGVDQLFPAFVVEVDADPRLVLDVVDDAVEQPVEVIDRRRAELDHGDILRQLDRDLHDWRDQHDRLVGVTQRMGDVAQAADIPQIAGTDADIEVIVQVFEKEDARFDITEHGVEPRDRVAGVSRSGLAPLGFGPELDHALAARPDVQRLVPLLGDLEQALFEAFFFPGHHVDDGIAGTDQYLELVGGPLRAWRRLLPGPALAAGRISRRPSPGVGSRCPFIPAGSGIMRVSLAVKVRGRRMWR